jgi:hypothetical protein
MINSGLGSLLGGSTRGYGGIGGGNSIGISGGGPFSDVGGGLGGLGIGGGLGGTVGSVFGLPGLGDIGGTLGVPTGSQFASTGQGGPNINIDFSQFAESDYPKIGDFDADGDGEISDEERLEFLRSLAIFTQQNKDRESNQPPVSSTPPVSTDPDPKSNPEVEPRPEQEPDEDEPSFLQRLREWYERNFGGRDIQIGGYPGGLGGIKIYHFLLFLEEVVMAVAVGKNQSQLRL